MLTMIYDSGEKTSLGWTLSQLRRVAWLLRDRFSADAWRVLNRFDRQFSKATPREPLRMGRTLNLLDDAIMTLSGYRAADGTGAADGRDAALRARRQERR